MPIPASNYSFNYLNLKSFSISTSNNIELTLAKISIGFGDVIKLTISVTLCTNESEYPIRCLTL